MTRDDTERAIAHFRRALVVLDGVGADREAAQLWFELANLLRECGAVEEAMEAFRRAGASTGLMPSSIPLTARVTPRSG